MGLLAEYRIAQHAEEVARLWRVLVLRAMVELGMSQRQIATEVGVSQSAISQQLKNSSKLVDAHPEVLLDAARSVLVTVATEFGYSRIGVFGSVARPCPTGIRYRPDCGASDRCVIIRFSEVQADC